MAILRKVSGENAKLKEVGAMTPVLQTCIDSERGDCHRAAIASLFDLELEQVPHFRLYPNDVWFKVYWYFIFGLGWEYAGSIHPSSFVDKQRNYESVKGYYLANVKSRTFVGKTHAVIIDKNGIVVHDPNPNGLYLDINVIETGDLNTVDFIKKNRRTPWREC